MSSANFKCISGAPVFVYSAGIYCQFYTNNLPLIPPFLQIWLGRFLRHAPVQAREVEWKMLTAQSIIMGPIAIDAVDPFIAGILRLEQYEDMRANIIFRRNDE